MRSLDDPYFKKTLDKFLSKADPLGQGPGATAAERRRPGAQEKPTWIRANATAKF